MYVASVPNRNSPPAILLRESFRQDGKVKTRTLANLSHLPPLQIQALRLALAGSLPAASSPLPDSFRISRSRPHGHVAAVLGSLRGLQLEAILDPAPSRERDLVVAMIVARIIEPASKLATARGLHSDTLQHSLGEMLQLQSANETELYQAMDWLLARQVRIEQELAKRQLSNGGLVLYDLTSTYFEGRHCPLGKLGHSRDDKSGKLQIVFGLLTNAAGCPVAVEVFAGNTGDPKTVAAQVTKLRQKFGLTNVVLVGDRGMITNARIRQDLPAEHGIEWISALRASQIQKLAKDGQLQMSLFDSTDLVEIAHPDFPGERLIACFNPLLAEERSRKRPDLLAATEKQLEKIAAATRRAKRPLRGKQNIGLRAGKIINRYNMGKHFQLRIEEDSFHYERKTGNIEREQKLDGIYVIRTSVTKEVLSSHEVVASYKSLAGVERAFRSLKTVDLQVRPIHHRLPDRVRAHILLCMLAYYVEWHMRQRLAPILFDDPDKPQAQAARVSIVAPAQRSPQAKSKALTKRTHEELPVHSFQTLLGDLATIAKNSIQPVDPTLPAF
ncbi:MAG: IS1634 family transposase, partial [Verrucomicrobia bacterium]|nr:IS1634 family transposase [Verrucomicrobiota bacterium]